MAVLNIKYYITVDDKIYNDEYYGEFYEKEIDVLKKAVDIYRDMKLKMEEGNEEFLKIKVKIYRRVIYEIHDDKGKITTDYTDSLLHIVKPLDDWLEPLGVHYSWVNTLL